jgi:hypothetical protein
MAERAKAPAIKRQYNFEGAVKVYDRLWSSYFKASTYATTPGRARSNIAYQVRQKANLTDRIPVTLIGDIRPV